MWDVRQDGISICANGELGPAQEIDTGIIVRAIEPAGSCVRHVAGARIVGPMHRCPIVGKSSAAAKIGNQVNHPQTDGVGARTGERKRHSILQPNQLGRGRPGHHTTDGGSCESIGPGVIVAIRIVWDQVNIRERNRSRGLAGRKYCIVEAKLRHQERVGASAHAVALYPRLPKTWRRAQGAGSFSSRLAVEIAPGKSSRLAVETAPGKSAKPTSVG